MKTYTTIPGMLFTQVERYQNRQALLRKVGEVYEPISWKELGGMVQEVAAGLMALGVQVGDRVGIMAYNRPEWVVADLAVMSIGAVTVPIYHTSPKARVDFILDKVKADIAFVARSEKAEILTTCEAPVKRIITLDPEGVDSPGACGYSYEELRILGSQELKEGRDKEFHERLASLKEDDCATIIFTSGTTGEPKGVMLSHKNILANARAGLEAVEVGPDDVFLSFLPLSHAFERTVGEYLMLMAGATIAYAASLRSVADNIPEVRPTIMLGVPRFYEKLYARVMEKITSAPKVRQTIFHWGMSVGRQCRLLTMAGKKIPTKLGMQQWLAEHLVFAKLKKRLGGRLRFFVSGGAPLAQEIGEFFLDAGVDIIEGYGLTEFSPVISVNRIGAIRPGTVGPPFPGVQVKIAEDGELAVKGDSVMLGYYQDEKGTSEVIRDGWLYTGDQAVLEEGYLRIVDRKKDIIVTSGGKNVPPQLVENLVVTDEYIAQIMLYGDRQKFISALVVPDYERLQQVLPSLNLAEDLSPADLAARQEVYDFLMQRIKERTKDLPAYEQVKKIIVLPEQFTEESGELTPTMKVKRKRVIEKYKAELDSLYAEKAA